MGAWEPSFSSFYCLPGSPPLVHVLGVGEEAQGVREVTLILVGVEFHYPSVKQLVEGVEASIPCPFLSLFHLKKYSLLMW